MALKGGAVYIDTTPRRSAPIPVEVTALGVVVRDIGTRYEVRVADGALRVRVRDGQIVITDGDTQHDVQAETEATRESSRWASSRSAPSGPRGIGPSRPRLREK